MAFIKNMKIGRRLGVGFALVLLLLTAVGCIGLVQSSRIYAGTRAISEDWLPSVEALSEIRRRADDVRRISLRELLPADEKGIGELHARRAAGVIGFAAAMQNYKKYLSSDDERRLYEGIESSWARYLETSDQVERLMGSADANLSSARQLAASEGVSRFATTLSFIDADSKLNHEGAVREVEAANAAFVSARVWTLILMIAALIGGVLIAFLITRSITVPLQQSVQLAERVAKGDLTSTIQADGKDEIGLLLASLGRMNEGLRETVARVFSGSGSIAISSAEIATGNADLSQRTEEQAASLQQTAASMEQLAATVRRNADDAGQGNLLASQACQTASRGEAIVGRVVQTMSDISTSSGKVTQIISVIEGIAFQTNILALNAAVEAARAGEQGRGFAVVASEVRTLAQRSASAAKEVRDLITQAVATVSDGSALVEDTGLTMREILESVQRVAELMQKISTASEEQHSGIAQATVAISQMDEVTQRNAALVEQVSAAAQSMAAQSRSLRDVVSVFKVPDVDR
ncbi:methyl-accepting chemotaxis protein [Paraburkholderia graminis]|uniref:methyl-accepting chemotaxis protein n=1 Tax=Paraburkholderia graminis TaxID=60548 RepID=UPI002857BC69|nr:methyl-accepting chemotaxis protein [Paraburkholderia graminis]MDR6477396.1 methyl-accepting chemotaxis protein [Paraburkholderia graminis]